MAFALKKLRGKPNHRIKKGSKASRRVSQVKADRQAPKITLKTEPWRKHESD